MNDLPNTKNLVPVVCLIDIDGLELNLYLQPTTGRYYYQFREYDGYSSPIRHLQEVSALTYYLTETGIGRGFKLR